MTSGKVLTRAGKLLIDGGKLITNDVGTGTCCCGTGTGEVCANCEDGNAPGSIQLVVSGIGDDACPVPTCNVLNGTFIMDYGIPSSCGWDAYVDLTGVCVSTWHYALTLNGAGYLGLRLIGPNLNEHAWGTDMGDVPIDCVTLNVGLPWINQTVFPANACDSSGSVVTVTAL